MFQIAQKGFTLIELMIVVAIIGILAAIAIPSYQDYIARAQASEAMTLAAGMKTALAEYYSDRGEWPSGTVFTDLVTDSGKYIESSDASGSNLSMTVTLTFRSTGVNAALQGETFGLYTGDGGVTWQCGNQSGADAVTTIDDKYLPGACK